MVQGLTCVASSVLKVAFLPRGVSRSYTSARSTANLGYRSRAGACKQSVAESSPWCAGMLDCTTVTNVQ